MYIFHTAVGQNVVKVETNKVETEEKCMFILFYGVCYLQEGRNCTVYMCANRVSRNKASKGIK